MLESLNKYVSDFNDQFLNDTIKPYTENDLNKVAVWNATGSGKTLIMHVNYHQYLHYSDGNLADDATYILLTPKEGLSKQHLDEYKASSILAKVYDKNASRWMRTAGEISVLENTENFREIKTKTLLYRSSALVIAMWFLLMKVIAVLLPAKKVNGKNIGMSLFRGLFSNTQQHSTSNRCLKR